MTFRIIICVSGLGDKKSTIYPGVPRNISNKWSRIKRCYYNWNSSWIDNLGRIPKRYIPIFVYVCEVRVIIIWTCLKFNSFALLYKCLKQWFATSLVSEPRLKRQSTYGAAWKYSSTFDGHFNALRQDSNIRIIQKVEHRLLYIPYRWFYHEQTQIGECQSLKQAANAYHYSIVISMSLCDTSYAYNYWTSLWSNMNLVALNLLRFILDYYPLLWC